MMTQEDELDVRLAPHSLAVNVTETLLQKTREFRRHTHPGPHKLRVQESSSSVREQMKEEDDIALSEGELHLQDVAHPMLYSSRQ